MKIKVVLFGEENSGKTTLVKFFEADSISVEAMSRKGHTITVGLDFGRLEVGGYHLYFFGTPGQERFDHTRQVVAQGAHLGILMVDSVVATNHGIQQRVFDFEQEMIRHKLPYVVCANKRDVPGVVSLSEIQRHFNVKVHPIVSTNGKGVDKVKSAMIDLLRSRYGEPGSKIVRRSSK